VPEQAFRRQHDERLSPTPQNLPPQNVEELRGRGGNHDLHVVLGGEHQQPFQRALECSGP
jgi:hypothetical protein